MASGQSSQHFRSRVQMQVWDHDPGTTAATVTSPDGGTTQRWMDMKDFDLFVAAVIQTVLGGSGCTKLEIVAAEDAAGTNLQVIKDSGSITLDALTEWAVQECTAEEVAHVGEAAGYKLRYVAARITTQNSGDEQIVVYQAMSHHHPHLDLTAAVNTL
jgi:hypothetical protein